MKELCTEMTKRVYVHGFSRWNSRRQYLWAGDLWMFKLTDRTSWWLSGKQRGIARSYDKEK